MQFKQDTALSDTSPQGPDWLGLNLQAANLRNADLRNADLDNANLEGADLRAANLQKANLQNANLRRANLEGADLKDARLDNAEVRDCNFNDSDLRDANLATVRGLDAQQLAGANLAGVGLPKEISDFSGLSFVNELSKDTQALFAVLLLACIYSWLTIASTQDVQLFTSTGSSELPIIRTTVPLLFVYGAGPILLLIIFIYFHIYMQRLWEVTSSLPAVFPDGGGLRQKINPWILNAFVFRQLPASRQSHPHCLDLNWRLVSSPLGG